jgi:hypothetical protein
MTPEARWRHYRELADVAFHKAQATQDPKLRADQLSLAAAWHALALDIEAMHRTHSG